MKTRAFCFTNFNAETDYEALVAGGQVKFIAYGKETCPTTGRAHDQGWMYFVNQRSSTKRALNNIGKLLGGDKPAHVEPIRGTLRENESYCSKESECIKVGEEPAQGFRGDLKETVDRIVSGEIRPDDVLVNDPMSFHQYGRTFDRALVVGLRRQARKEQTKGIWYCGPTGSGKSHAAFTVSFGDSGPYDPSTHYVKNLQEEWWDGYTGQPVVILNEFRGEIKFSELLDLVDKWPKAVKWRNRESVPFLAKYVVVTCIKRPRDCYKNLDSMESWDQFDRRFEIRHLGEFSELEASDEA